MWDTFYSMGVHFTIFCQFISRIIRSLEISRRVIWFLSMKRYGIISQSLICYDLLDIFLFSYVMYFVTLNALRLQSRKMLTLNMYVHVSLTNISLRKQCFTHPVLWNADTRSWKPQLSMIIIRLTSAAFSDVCAGLDCCVAIRVQISVTSTQVSSVYQKMRTLRYSSLCFNFL